MERVFSQVDPLSPAIFKMVVDSVVQHWMTWVCGRWAEYQVLGVNIVQTFLIFYADYGWLSEKDGTWIQYIFNGLVGCFEWVYLNKIIPITKQSISLADIYGGWFQDIILLLHNSSRLFIWL